MKNIGFYALAVIVVGALIMKLSAPSIQGQWVGQSIIDNGTDTLKVDPSSFILSITDNQYSFVSDLSETEEGHVTRSGKSIILSPDDNSTPYRIEIVDISRNRLALEMMVEDTHRNVTLNRVTETL